ncbi:DUF5719 family protein [Leucobacter sp. W1153]|uniref:DUF5719 family protein n=1 Tax=Leucobacter sp. W1153 TaxID=3439064 RepID=UPI003F301D99
MSEKSSVVLRGSLRATTGLVILGIAAAAVAVLGTAPLPEIERSPVALTVDTMQGAERDVVCAGAFAVLGADPARPSLSLPVGEASVTVAGEAATQSELLREEAGGSAPQVMSVPAGDRFAAAQVQTVTTDTLRGLSASACAEPANEQWLVGGATTLGVTTTVNLGNPSEVPATVQLTVFDENGEVDSKQTSGVLIPGGSDRVVSLNGYAPGREQLAVRIVSTGAAVTATLGVAHVTELSPFAVDTVTRQLAPNPTLVIPGLTNLSEHDHGPGDAGELDPFSVRFRVLAPGGESGSASIRALFPDGSSEDLGSLEYGENIVTEMPIAHWPEEANAAIITAADPLVGAAFGSADQGAEHDYAWFTPAPLLQAETDVAAAVVSGGQLVLVNPGSEDAEVRIAGSGADSDRESKRIIVPGGGAVVAAAPAAAILRSDAPIVAGVRVAAGGNISGYPVIELNDRASTITVFTR